MTLDVVRVPVAALPAGSRSVEASVYDHEPELGTVVTRVHDPLHPPVTVNVTVRLSALTASVPA